MKKINKTLKPVGLRKEEIQSRKKENKQAQELDYQIKSARGETRTLKDMTPTASETATFTNFATRAGAVSFI